MTIVDWAHVVLPTACLVAGGYLTYRYRREIDLWVAHLDTLLQSK